MSASELHSQHDRINNGQTERGFGKMPIVEFNSADYLSWRRLHLSKSKLSNVAEMAGFMAGFAVVATVELQINDDANPPLLTAFVITTSLLVGTCMIAVIIARCVLPHLESVAKTSNISGANISPHDKMMKLIDISWILTNSASLFFFTLDIILMCWIKYKFFTTGASIAATVIMAPVLVIIVVFALLFYRRIVKHQYVISSIKCEELDKMHKNLERASSLNSISYQGTITSNYQTVTSNTLPPNSPYGQPIHQRPFFFLPNSQNPSPQTPRTPRNLHFSQPNFNFQPHQSRNHPLYNNNNSSNNNSASSPSRRQMPNDRIFFSMHPNPEFDSRSTSALDENASPTLPLSPTGSDNSVFTV